MLGTLLYLADIEIQPAPGSDRDDLDRLYSDILAVDGVVHFEGLPPGTSRPGCVETQARIAGDPYPVRAAIEAVVHAHGGTVGDVGGWYVDEYVEALV